MLAIAGTGFLVMPCGRLKLLDKFILFFNDAIWCYASAARSCVFANSSAGEQNIMRRPAFGSVHVIKSPICPGCPLDEKTTFGPHPPGCRCIVLALVTIRVNVVLLVVICEMQPVVVVIKLTGPCTAALLANRAAFSVFDALELGPCTKFCNKLCPLVVSPCELVTICACVTAAVIGMSYAPLVVEHNVSGLKLLDKSVKLCRIAFNYRLTICAFV